MLIRVFSQVIGSYSSRDVKIRALTLVNRNQAWALRLRGRLTSCCTAALPGKHGFAHAALAPLDHILYLRNIFSAMTPLSSTAVSSRDISR